MTDLSRLNQAERETLTLLAQGHTAKSIASLTGRSPGAINERLREARRKTGVGSSRELARLFARENRDELSVIAAGNPARPNRPTASRPGRRMLRGILMSVPIAAVALALVVHQQDAAPATPIYDDSPTALRDRLAGETRDPAWASASEAALRRRYAAVDGIDRSSLSVRCAATLCEVNARMLPASSAAQNRTISALQGKALADVLGEAGLVNKMQSFHSNRMREQTFAAFWSKRDAAKPVTSAS